MTKHEMNEDDTPSTPNSGQEPTVTDKNNVMDSSFQDDVEGELERMVEERRKDQQQPSVEIPSVWKMTSQGKEAVQKAVAMTNTTFGLYASIPMICKGEDCVYAKLFPELHNGLSEPGGRCPVEVAMIMTKYNAYTEELGIEEDDAVDMSILRDIIDYDIQIVRAENKMALEGDFVKDVAIGVSPQGEEITQEQISQAAQYKDKIQAKRNNSLKLLNSTRKDKAGEKINMVMDPSTYAQNLLKDSQAKSSVDADWEELDVIDDVPYVQENMKQGKLKGPKKRTEDEENIEEAPD